MRPRLDESPEAGESHPGGSERLHGGSPDHPPALPSPRAPPSAGHRHLRPGPAWRLRLPLRGPRRAGGLRAGHRRCPAPEQPQADVPVHHRSGVAAVIFARTTGRREVSLRRVETTAFARKALGVWRIRTRPSEGRISVAVTALEP